MANRGFKRAFGIVAVCLIGSFAAGVRGQSCSGASRPGYNCLGGMLCGAGATCACPHDTTVKTVGTGTFDCYNPHDSPYYSCPSGGQITTTPPNGPTQAGATCSSSTTGDPLMTGFLGCRWYMKGEAGLVYNLVSGPEDTLNTLLVPANITDAHHDNDGTFHGAIFIRHGDHNITAVVDEAGRLEVAVDGHTQAAESAFTAGEMSGTVHQYLPYHGQAARIVTAAFVYFIHAVQPYTDQSGFNRGHADVEVTITNPVPDLHGLLGQSIRTGMPCSTDFSFAGEGRESDYAMATLGDVNFKYSRFGQFISKSLSRKTLQVEESFAPLTAKLG